jgi:hypothetical protein
MDDDGTLDTVVDDRGDDRMPGRDGDGIVELLLHYSFTMVVSCMYGESPFTTKNRNRFVD